MPIFFIDTSDEELFIRDEHGKTFADTEAAKRAAVAVFPDMARDKLPDGDARTFLAFVRGQDGRTLLQAALTLKITSLIPDAKRLRVGRAEGRH